MGYRIREFREEKRISQQELAEKAGVSRQTISNLENNPTAETTVGTLGKIAKALDKRLCDIFFEVDV